MSKKILMVAGPNGAGKTTVALELIANRSMLYEFINADELLQKPIARKNIKRGLEIIDRDIWKRIEKAVYER